MTGLRIRLALDGDVQLDRTLARIGDAVEDMRPAWDELADKFARDNAAQFDTEGAASSGGWAALSPNYAEWKDRVRPGRPILVFDGRLRRSLTSRPFGVENITARTLEVGTDVEYARYHQQGTPYMPRRRPVELTEGQRRDWLKILQRYIVEETRRAQS